jgi:hypothetical protein
MDNELAVLSDAAGRVAKGKTKQKINIMTEHVRNRLAENSENCIPHTSFFLDSAP